MVHDLLRSLLAAATLAIAPISAAESGAVLTSTWEVRQQLRELLDVVESLDTVNLRLFDSLQTFLAAHGHELAVYQGQYRPVADHVIAALKRAELLDDYQRHVAPMAREALEEVSSFDIAELERVARRFPASGVSAEAWSRLADLSWDRGLIAHSLRYAERAGSAHAIAERKRAARHLLDSDETPLAADNNDRLWQAALSAGPAPSSNSRSGPPPMAINAAPIDRTALAITNGTRLLLVDTFTGERLAPSIAIADDRRWAESAGPVPCQAGIVVFGHREGRPHLMLIGHNGETRWRQPIASVPDPRSAAFSRPVVRDRMVYLASVEFTNGTRSTFLNAFDVTTGNRLWRRMVASISEGDQMRWAMRNTHRTAPLLHAMEDWLVIATHTGFVAAADVTGETVGLWTYERDARNPLVQNDGGKRQSSILTDGNLICLSPVDCNGVLVLDRESGRLTSRIGQQWLGLPVAIDGDDVLLVDQHIRHMDWRTGAEHWRRTLDDTPHHATGRTVHGGGWLVAADNAIITLNADGEIRGREHMAPDTRVVIAGNVLVAYDGERLSARGDGEAFRSRIMERMRMNPEDHKPWASLASLELAAGKTDQALDHFLAALDRGAPARVAHRAASILRPLMDLHLGSRSFDQVRQRFARVAAHDTQLKQELRWWLGRSAELAGDSATARGAYHDIIRAEPGHTLPAANGLQVDLKTLCRLGLQRLDSQLSTPGPGPDEQARFPSRMHTAWKQSWQVHGLLLASGNRLLARADGRLRAIDLQDGTAIWNDLNTERPLLGVLHARGEEDAGQEGVQVRILPGFAAERMGVQDGDVIKRCNATDIRSFTDLTGAVAEAGPGGAVELVVARGMEQLELSGELDGWPRSPVAVADGWMLAQRLMLQSTRDGTVVRPDRHDQPALDLFRIEDGQQIAHIPLTPQSTEQAPWNPVVSADGNVLVDVQGDLVAMAATQDGVQEIWRLPDGGAALETAHLTDEGLLVGSLHSRRSVWLVDITSGEVIATLASATRFLPHLDAHQLFACTQDGALARWDLDTARLIWRAESQVNEIVAVRNDQVLALDGSDQLVVIDRANGHTRSRFGQWSRIYQTRIVGPSCYVHAHTIDQRDIIARIHLPTANVAWQQVLPAPSEVLGELQADESGVGVMLSIDDHQRSALLLAGADGAPRASRPLADGTSLHLLAGRALIRRDHTLSALPMAEPPGDRVIPKPGQELRWFETEGRRWGIRALEGSAFEVVVDTVPQENADLTMLATLSDSMLATSSNRIQLKADGTVAVSGRGTALHWDVQQLADETVDGRRIRRYRIAPPPDPLRSPARIRGWFDTEHHDVPWWHTGFWLREDARR